MTPAQPDFAAADRELPILGGCRTVPLVGGGSSLVDEEDFATASRWEWIACTPPRSLTAYAKSRCVVEGRRQAWLHRFIMSAEKGAEVDHRNGDGLDNRRSNLRLATRVQNAWNAPPRGGRRFKGVRRVGRRYYARITFDGREIALGSFPTEEEAARAYDRAARDRFGEFARLNFAHT